MGRGGLCSVPPGGGGRMLTRTELAWALEAGADRAALEAGWKIPTVVGVPVGATWDVVRITSGLGWTALARLRSISAPIGPVLETPVRGTIEVVVPTGTAAAWPAIPGTRAVARGVLWCPPPHVTFVSRSRTLGGRCWIVPPGMGTDAADADMLCEAVAASLLHRAPGREARS